MPKPPQAERIDADNDDMAIADQGAVHFTQELVGVFGIFEDVRQDDDIHTVGGDRQFLGAGANRAGARGHIAVIQQQHRLVYDARGRQIVGPGRVAVLQDVITRQARQDIFKLLLLLLERGLPQLAGQPAGKLFSDRWYFSIIRIHYYLPA